MDKEQLNRLAGLIVQAAWSENEDEIVEGLLKNVSRGAKFDTDSVRVICNAVKSSTVLAVEIMMDMLLKTGVFKLSDEITKPHLEVIPGGQSREQ